MVVHGEAKKGHHNIDWEVLKKRNQFGPLRIRERDQNSISNTGENDQ